MRHETAGSGRIARPDWRDPRLYLGLLLVLLAAGGSFLILTKANRTETYAVVSKTLATGSSVNEALAERQMNLADSSEGYLRPGDPRLANAKLRRPLAEGSLIRAEDLAPREESVGRTYALSLDQPIPEGVKVGSEVEVWIAAKQKEPGQQGYKPAERRVERAEVLKVEQSDGGLGGNTRTTVHLLLGEKDLPLIIDAVANEAKVALVPLKEQR